jgi:hypothetical protein
VYTPVFLPTWEPNLGKFIQVQAGEERLAVSSDRRITWFYKKITLKIVERAWL